MREETKEVERGDQGVRERRPRRRRPEKKAKGKEIEDCQGQGQEGKKEAWGRSLAPMLVDPRFVLAFLPFGNLDTIGAKGRAGLTGRGARGRGSQRAQGAAAISTGGDAVDAVALMGQASAGASRLV